MRYLTPRVVSLPQSELLSPIATFLCIFFSARDLSSSSVDNDVTPRSEPAVPAGPGTRHSLAIAAGGDGRGLYLFGGSRQAKGGFKPKVFDDLWYFRESIVKGSELLGEWTLLGLVQSSAPVPWPPPRGHHSLVTLAAGSGVDVGVLLFGGALCIPGCSCYNDTWVWSPQIKRWSEAKVPKLPIHRYRQTLVPTDEGYGTFLGSFLLFGGESYKPYMYHNSVQKLSFPHGWLKQRISAAKSTEMAESQGAQLPLWSAPHPSVALPPSLKFASLDSGPGVGEAGFSPVLIALLGLAAVLLCCWRTSRKRLGYSKPEVEG
mmetsp:Transcript_37639/g.93455  ORF Transcript_37639/g.93455 Transcript_37639/m.93455 type:complete len:318 (-) Transcript_37639:218-1171(-)